MSKPHVLLIGELKEALALLTTRAHEDGIKALQAPDIESALSILCSQKVDMVFLDSSAGMPQFFTGLNEAKLTIPTVCVGPAQPVQNAVKAIRLGAIEYLSTPVDEDILDNLLAKIRPVESDDWPIAGDENTLEILRQAKQFAKSNATVLLRGESGTGKEVFSQYIHKHSKRASENFVSINCAAIPENLLESELFGHEKGAFSGALSRRVGKFQQADKGTLLLDEISEMDVLLQTKLLRAIQERVIDPVGSTEPVPVDIRLIATTNRDLEKEVEKGTFREDLYFRLNVVMLEIPPLRERRGDIEPLSRFFAEKYAAQNDIQNIDLAPDAVEKLVTCYWKGNVRELENTVHRAVLMMGDENVMKAEHIVISPMSQNMMSNTHEGPVQEQKRQQAAASGAAGAYAATAGGYSSGMGATRTSAPMVGRALSEVEKELILSTLDYCQGNRTHAAEVLGISIRTLRNKLKEYEEIVAQEEAVAG